MRATVKSTGSQYALSARSRVKRGMLEVMLSKSGACTATEEQCEIINPEASEEDCCNDCHYHKEFCDLLAKLSDAGWNK